MEYSVATQHQGRMSINDNIARAILFAALGKMSHGKLTITDKTGQFQFGRGEFCADIHVINPQFYRQVLWGGSIGAGEAYMDGHWQSSSVTNVIKLFALNLTLLDKIERRFAWASTMLNRFKHMRQHNSTAGSKRNILAHYDLGNEMYQLFLDPLMLYSSAIYADEQSSLAQAQENKMQLICERLDLQAGQSLLEIGTGWGALAIYAAKHFDVDVTTTTISDAQYNYAKQHIIAAGLEHKITLLKQDYRELTGEFDRIVSIEMIEAVGHEYMAEYFTVLNRHLKHDGRMLIQAITINDERYQSYRNNVDFIQRYIFPGGCLPSVAMMNQHLAQQTQMKLWSIDEFGLDYARTLNDWLQRFNHALPQVKALGYDEQFIRMWQFYLGYCEGGFLAGTTNTVHYVAVGRDYQG